MSDTESKEKKINIWIKKVRKNLNIKIKKQQKKKLGAGLIHLTEGSKYNFFLYLLVIKS